MTTDELITCVIGAALRVHRALGPGLLESTYEMCLARELDANGLGCSRQQGLPVNYNGTVIRFAYRVDLLVEQRLIVEVKSVARVERVHFAQVRTYLKHSGCTAGLLLNFNVPMLREGIHRVTLARGILPPLPGA